MHFFPVSLKPSLGVFNVKTNPVIRWVFLRKTEYKQLLYNQETSHALTTGLKVLSPNCFQGKDTHLKGFV